MRPGLCQHRPEGIHKGKKIKLYEIKNEKNYKGFHIPKIQQILKRFSRGILVENKPLIFSEE